MGERRLSSHLLTGLEALLPVLFPRVTTEQVSVYTCIATGSIKDGVYAHFCLQRAVRYPLGYSVCNFIPVNCRWIFCKIPQVASSAARMSGLACSVRKLSTSSACSTEYECLALILQTRSPTMPCLAV